MRKSIFSIALLAGITVLATSCTDSVDLDREAKLRAGIERIERENALNDGFSVAPLSASLEDCPNCGSWSTATGGGSSTDGFLNMQSRQCTSGSTSYKQYREVGTTGPSCGTIARCYCSPWSSKWGLVVKQCVRVSPTGGETWGQAVWMDPNASGNWPTDSQLCPTS